MALLNPPFVIGSGGERGQSRCGSIRLGIRTHRLHIFLIRLIFYRKAGGDA